MLNQCVLLVMPWTWTQMMSIKVFQSFLFKNKVFMPSIVDDELSFVSNDSTLVQESPKPCSRCRRDDVLFDFNHKKGKNYAYCRSCKDWNDKIRNPINNPINNPKNNKKVTFTQYSPKDVSKCTPPFWCCIGF